MEPKQFHQFYKQKQSVFKKTDEGSESEEYYKEADTVHHYFNSEYNPQN